MRRTILLALAIGLGLVSSAAWAGDLRCVVTGKEGPQADVQVTVTPGGATLTTARDGTCLFRGLREGTYRVTAERTVGGQLRGAVADDVRVRASGRADVKLQLVRAIHIHEYIPLREGSTWTYRFYRHEWHEYMGWRSTMPGAMWGWREGTAAGTARFAGADVTKVEWAGGGWLASYADTPLYTVYETSGPEGHTIYGRTSRTSPNSLGYTYIPPFRYEPPLLIPELLPLGHAHRLTARIRFGDDRPSVRVTRTYTLAKFERRDPPAGVFDDCARIEWTEEVGDTTTTGVMHLAKGVGMVHMEFDDGQVMESLFLAKHHTSAPSAARTVPGAAKPKPPSSTMPTPSKSLPSK